MNSQATFTAFLTNPLGITTARVKTEVSDFVQTFNDLLSTTEEEIDTFVKNVHGSNSARAGNAKILIPTSAVLGLKSLLYELKDRELCDALPDQPTLVAIDANQLSILRQQRSTGLDAERRRKESNLPDMDVPKLTNDNFDEFHTAFAAIVARLTSRAGVGLDYLLRSEDLGNYNAVYPTREEKLKACLSLQGSIFKEDSESLYSLLVQHIGSTGTGSNIIKKYKDNKNGRKCYMDIKFHFQNGAYRENMATAAENALREAKYYGDRRNFTLESYYTIMTNCFNNLELAGPAHALSEEQKVTKFESGLVEEKSIDYSIQCKTIWDLKPMQDKTFDIYFNDLSALMSRRNNLTNRNNGGRRVRISQINTTGRGRGGRGGRGNGRGGRQNSRNGRGRGGRGFGRGRGRNNYNPYQLARSYDPNFAPEARVYSNEEFRNLSRQQKQQVSDLKAAQGWVDGNSPPSGFILGNDGRPTLSTHLVAAVQASIGSVTGSTAALPPPPRSDQLPIPSIINTNPLTAGQTFVRRGSNQPPADSSASISSVSIVNGRQYRGQVFDAQGNPLN